MPASAPPSTGGRLTLRPPHPRQHHRRAPEERLGVLTQSTMSRLCPPAAAISSARLALSWPFSSTRSSPAERDGTRRGSGGGKSCVPLKRLTIANRLGAAMVSTSPAQAASPPHEAGEVAPLPAPPAASAVRPTAAAA